MKYMKSIYLKNEPFYDDSGSKVHSGTLYGTYYVWGNRVVNGRIKITTDQYKVGIKGQELGWVAVTCLTTKAK